MLWLKPTTYGRLGVKYGSWKAKYMVSENFPIGGRTFQKKVLEKRILVSGNNKSRRNRK